MKRLAQKEKQSPTISVIIPCYNREKTITRAIDSVLSQTYPAHEIIVVDDGSTDESHKVLSQIYQKNKIKYIYQKNAGSAAARNAGIAFSNGEWIAFLDSDDEWLENKLKLDVEAINSDKNCRVDFIHGDRLHRFPDGRLDSGRDYEPASDLEDREHMLSGWCIKTSTVLVKASLLRRVDRHFQQGLKTCQDYEFFWRLVISSNKIKYIPYANVIINLTDDGASRIRPKLKLIQDNIFALNSALDWSKDKSRCKNHEKILERRIGLESLDMVKEIFNERNLFNVLRNFWINRSLILNGAIKTIKYKLKAY